MVVTDGGQPSSTSTWRRLIEEQQRHLTTVDGWRRFTTDTPEPPDPHLPDEARLDYHTRLTVVATSTLRQVINAGRRLTLLNRHAISARRGLILSGPAGTGKTTAITQLGKTHETIDRTRHPSLDDRIPVVYVTVPPATTPRRRPRRVTRRHPTEQLQRDTARDHVPRTTFTETRTPTASHSIWSLRSSQATP